MSGHHLSSLTGIVLKSMPLGEADKILTIFTREAGVIRAVAPGIRKATAKLGGRAELFVVNDWQLARGRWSHAENTSTGLYRITQADMRHSHTLLSRSVERFVAAQYLAEVALLQAPVGHPQPELYLLLLEHLHRLEQATPAATLPLLVHGLYHFLALAGVAPQVFECHYCRCQPALVQETPFSLHVGGIVCDPCRMAHRPHPLSLLSIPVWQALQTLPDPILPDTALIPSSVWLGVERVLRRMVEFHTERPVQSSQLLDSLLGNSMIPMGILHPA